MSNSHEATLVVVDLGSPLSVSHKDTRDAKEVEVEDVSYNGTHGEQSQQDNARLLSTLSSHLDLLTAGSLFLLPSILPYLASALTSYTTDNATSALNPPPSSSPQYIPSPPLTNITSPTTASNSWNWQTTWIILLPCIGVIVPLSLLKVMTMLEESSFQCPFRRWRQNKTRIGRSKSGSNTQRSPICTSCYCAAPAAQVKGARSATRMTHQQKFQRHGIMFGPTVHAIKRAWKVLKREPSGYGPLSLDSPLSEGFSGDDDDIYGSESESECESEKTMVESTVLTLDSPLESKLLHEQGPHGAPCSCKNNYSVRQQLSVLPRPRSILLASLAVWTALMAFSSVLGFNTVRPTLPISNDANETAGGFDLQTSEPISMGIFHQGGFVAVEEPSFPSDDSIDYDESERDFLNVVAGMLEQNLANLEEELNQPLSVNQDEPFATIKTSIIIVNKRSPYEASAPLSQESTQVEEEEEEEENVVDIEDFLEPDSLDALTMDPDDETVFHDFLAQLEAEDQAAKALEESNLEAHIKKQKQIIKATNDLVISSMLENDIPCGARTFPMRLTPTWIIGLPDIVQKILDSAGSGRFGEREDGQMFEYLAGWTEFMILAVTMSLGAIMAGLAQAKMLYYQLSESSESSVSGAQKGGCASITTLLSCLALSGSALGLTLLMIFSECWDVPSVYFVGIGIAGMILVHAWVPDVALQVEYADDLDMQDGYQLVYDEEANY
ncbi:hypothetical protein BGX26_010797 [Mortierella sp. AD094]|nr:hypothetical protein BGX26_010797 [Mortierella sp. AD094]